MSQQTAQAAGEEQARLIMDAAGAGKDKVTLTPGGEFRIDYAVENNSSVTKDKTTAARVEYFTCTNASGSVLYAVNRAAAHVTAEESKQGKRPQLPPPVCAQPPAQRKGPCTFWRKGTCRSGVGCQFSHNFVPQRASGSGKAPCRFHFSAEGCRFGDRCRYSHEQ